MVIKQKGKTGFGLLEILLVLIILSSLSYFSFKFYFSPRLDDKAKVTLEKEGIDTSNYRALSESLKDKVNQANQESLRRQQAIEDIE